MRSATASRAVSISTGTRLPGAAQAPAHLEAVDVRQPDVEHHGVRARSARSRRARCLAVLDRHGLVAAQHERAPQGVAQRAVVVDDQDAHPVHCGCRRGLLRRFLRRSYAAPTYDAGVCSACDDSDVPRSSSSEARWRSPPSATAWAPRRATAPRSRTTRRPSRTEAARSAAARRRSAFERGAPPGFSALADKLGVNADRARCSALRDYHDQHEADRRDEFAAKLAKALGISTDKVQSAFDGLHQRREDRFAARLADALGVDAARVKAALDKLEGERPRSPGDFAQKLADELGVDVSDVRAALMKIRPFDAPGRDGPTATRRRPGPGHHDGALPLRQLATAARREPRGPARRVPPAPRRGRERLEAGAAGARQVPGGPLQPRREHGAGRAGRRGAATKVTASARDHATIPQLFEEAAAAVPDRRWLLFEDETYTYAQARERIARGRRGPEPARGREGRPRARHRAQRPALRVPVAGGRLPRRHLRGRRPAPDRGRAGRPDRPGGAEARRHGRRTSTSCSREPGELDGPGPADPRRPGRADPDLRHHRALEARDADAPRLRDGRRGLPVVARPDRGRPADDLAAALPHQRARLLGARLGGRARRASCCSRASRPAASSTPPAATAPPSSTRSARCSRS